MLVIFIKAVVTFFFVLVVMRIMGKRQLGEMQPFELVITLLIAEVACVPMNDPFIPFYQGLIPVITLATLHLTVSFVSRKSMRARKLVSGESVIVIDKKGINYENLKKMNINVNDLIEATRSSGYVDFAEIQYAIIETNGKLCVVEKPSDPTVLKPAFLPLPLLIDGVFDERNLALAGAARAAVIKSLNKKGYNDVKEILFIDVRQDGTIYVSPKAGECYTDKITISGGDNW
ncbi:MAG: DUF421 domain-containing protein [Clostridiales bacterium]|jgi:uncharacterized membrane protein YcaP (DUF421 family)|nr:DUF421 domain-containing protein [Clostridiales bacterium]